MSQFASVKEVLNHDDENNRVVGINTTVVPKPPDSPTKDSGAYPRTVISGSITKAPAAIRSNNGNCFTGGDVFNINLCPPSTGGLSTCSLLTVELTPDPRAFTPVPKIDNDDLQSDNYKNTVIKTPSTDTFLRIQGEKTPTNISFDNSYDQNNANDANEDSFNDISARSNSSSSSSNKGADSDGNVLKTNEVKTTSKALDHKDEGQKEDDEEISEEDRVRIDLEASERLAWEMMRQESLETYRLQMEYMQENSANLSQEDLAMIQQVVNESAQALNAISAAQGDEGEEGEEDGSGESDSSEWDYDRLLALGEQIGDVKTERWKAKAPRIIEKLTQMTYEEVKHEINGKKNYSNGDFNSNDINNKKMRLNLEEKCAVCMEVYQEQESIILLHCSHYFHSQCASSWISGSNSCPMCKSTVVPSP